MIYIAHATIIVVATPSLARQLLPQALAAVLLVTLTAYRCVLAFLTVHRVPMARHLHGRGSCAWQISDDPTS